MTITVDNIKLLASARMTDTEDGGGQMAGTGLQDGLDNNVFADTSSTDRAFGRLSLKKVWPAVQSANTDTLLGAHVILDDVPDDADVRGWAMLGTSASEDRVAAVRRLQTSHWEALGATGYTWATAPYLYQRLRISASGVPPQAGHVVYTSYEDGAWRNPLVIRSVTEVLSGDGTFGTGYPSMTGGDRVFAVTTEGELPAAVESIDPTTAARLGVPATTTPRLITTRPVTGTLSTGATHCDVDTLLAPVVPKQPGAAAGSEAQIGIDPAAITPAGLAVSFRSGDGLVLHHTGEVAAATYANGNTINCGRTGLASVRVIGDDGLSIPGGWSVNLATGIVTVTDISGWDQPVTVRHTIEEVLACSRTGYPEVSGGSSGSGTSEATVPFTLSAGLTMFCGRPNVGSIRVISRLGQDITLAIAPDGASRAFFINLAAGTAQFGDFSFYAVQNAAFIASHSPVTLVSSGSFSAVGVASAPGANLNRITFNRALTKDFPAGTLVSSMLFLGDLRARAGVAFSQESWTSVWADSRIGSSIVPQYQQALNPIAVTNQGAIAERWAFIFTSATQFRLVGETLGQIATGDVNSVFAPINPATGVPYFTIAAAGWGVWSAGNVLRLNTYGANAPVWAARVTLPSAPSSTPDSLTIAVRGDIDA